MPIIGKLKELFGNSGNSHNNNSTSPSTSVNNSPKQAQAQTIVSGSDSSSKREMSTQPMVTDNYNYAQPIAVTDANQSTQPVSINNNRNTDLNSRNVQAVNTNAAIKEQAEALVRRENEARQKREAATYEGLPDGLVLGIKMGDGAFSNVYQATLTSVDPTIVPVKVAVKCIRQYELNYTQGLAGKHHGEKKEKKPRATERASILKEVQIMRGLNHPSIVRLFNFTEAREHYFLTIELMEGGELFHQIVKLTYFSEELSRHVILQVAHGIRYLHEEKGVVHRDIKPENILFDEIPIIPSKHPKSRPYDEEKEDEGEFIQGIGGGGIGRVKIADFGLSKIIWNEQTNTPAGTIGYTAPEIVKDERYSKSVDMWALGCVLYTLLCGFPPFYDESINVLTEKVARGYYTFLSPWWDDISASSKDLITHLLEVDPRKRYTIDEFLAHPWTQQKAPPPAFTPTTLESINGLQQIPKFNASHMPIDSPLLAPGGRRAMPSPGVASLKEAFDVTYAVHRMEEEGAARRRVHGASGGFMQGLHEDDEDDDEDIETTKRRYGAEVSKAIEDKRRQVQEASGRTADAPTGTYQGWGGADRKMAEAALYDGRAGPRDRGRRDGKKAGFELTLDKATLLGRRKGPQAFAGVRLAEIAPGSPMRIE